MMLKSRNLTALQDPYWIHKAEMRRLSLWTPTPVLQVSSLPAVVSNLLFLCLPSLSVLPISSLPTLLSTVSVPICTPVQPTAPVPNYSPVRPISSVPICTPARPPVHFSPSSPTRTKPYIKKKPQLIYDFLEGVAQFQTKHCATVNKVLGKMWHSLSAEQKKKYYEEQTKESRCHYELHLTSKPQKKVSKQSDRACHMFTSHTCHP
ncbi:transcription factor 7-like 1 [Thalassophryne amazonica]|uniref:transcription factor 7-like 1 n=1 Tax=Thalassophryne amazonica TaxID=390379 RepID=UPI001471EA93|nr:transcription factor 7-like 1 [Thalassophryne amazonica]